MTSVSLYESVVIRMGIFTGLESDCLNNMYIGHIHIVSMASAVASLFVLEDMKILNFTIQSQFRETKTQERQFQYASQ